MRPRTPMEAADLGVRLCQSAARSIFPCYWAVGIPIVALCLASFEISTWLPSLLLWWAKPWLDRSILFVLSRAAFGQTTRPMDLVREQRAVWWRQFYLSVTIRRLSPWRSFTQPVYQLEGLSLGTTGKRVRQIRRGKTSPAILMTFAFATAEFLLTVALTSLIFWFTPGEVQSIQLFAPQTYASVALPMAFAYALVVLFLEPFYVAAGFAMYLNRRAQLEAWDIEQELRRAFPE
jgi:hypothetical protein